jgi:hypothetical protein
MAAASAPGIGTLRERPLHASLKRWYAEAGDRTEVAVDGYVIDLVRGDLLIEVQTRGLSSARHKVAALLGRGHRLRVIFPIAVDTWIVKFDADGGVLSRRRSPRHGIASDVFRRARQRRHPAGRSGPGDRPRADRDGGAPVSRARRTVASEGLDRRGTSTRRGRGQAPLRGVADLAALLPAGLPEPSRRPTLQRFSGATRRAAQQMAYCLRLADVIVLVGKRGHVVEYRVVTKSRSDTSAKTTATPSP